MSSPLVYFKCVKERSKLRVRIISPGYNNEANCQFPRAIRRDGGRYSAPPTAITFARGPAGKFFYRVSKSYIKTVDAIEDITQDLAEVKVSVDKVYEDEDSGCVVCLDAGHEVVIVPCGHFCMCKECATTLQHSTHKCPMCRGRIDLLVTKDQIQT